MSSQASSAGHGEKDVRRGIVETGAVDVMIAIRSNFFYTRSVPCELWHFDKGKPKERLDQVLMIDARHIYRKVNRKIFDFTPEQLKNISAMVWLYRGQQDRYLDLLNDYLQTIADEAGKLPVRLTAFDEALARLLKPLKQKPLHPSGDSSESFTAFNASVMELKDAFSAYKQDRDGLEKVSNHWKKTWEKFPIIGNSKQIQAQEDFAPVAEECRGLVKQIDLLYKLAARCVDALSALTRDLVKEEEENAVEPYKTALKTAKRELKDMDEKRRAAVGQLKQTAYFHRQAHWLQSRFPEARFADVQGLCKRVDRKEIEDNDWSLTPGRYVGVAPVEEDEDFDFEETLREIHVELEDLNSEAVTLAATIRKNFEELGI